MYRSVDDVLSTENSYDNDNEQNDECIRIIGTLRILMTISRMTNAFVILLIVIVILLIVN
jgi:hypothetical protein